MNPLENIVDWARDTFLPYGGIGLFAVAFMESSFFPVPPDIILIPLALLFPEMAIFYAALAILGSVLGAIFGYFIGFYGGRPVLEKLASEKTIKRIEKYYEEYGVLAVGVAGFTPIPYKIFTISSGIFEMKLKSFILVSLFSRGARFFLEAIFLMVFGGIILEFFYKYFEVLTLLGGIVLVLIYIVYKRHW